MEKNFSSWARKLKLAKARDPESTLAAGTVQRLRVVHGRILLGIVGLDGTKYCLGIRKDGISDDLLGKLVWSNHHVLFGAQCGFYEIYSTAVDPAELELPADWPGTIPRPLVATLQDFEVELYENLSINLPDPRDRVVGANKFLHRRRYAHLPHVKKEESVKDVLSRLAPIRVQSPVKPIMDPEARRNARRLNKRRGIVF